jgi:pimeloyl-ACP methyl ester carboxylesterase
VPDPARFRILPALLVILVTVLVSVLCAAEGITEGSEQAPSSIVIGFVGGFVRHDNPHHGPVRLAQRMHRSLPKDAYIQIFENRHRKTAYHTILRLLDRNHDGVLSEDEKASARIILFGHSWGASATVLLARELKHEGIPVLLTVQVDSVAKFWQKDGVIPENVLAAVNFYQPHGIVRGRAEITAADPTRTEILGNYLYDYKRAPVKCEGTSWFERVFTPDHMQSECDPQLWNQVETLVLRRTQPQPGVVAQAPRP